MQIERNVYSLESIWLYQQENASRLEWASYRLYRLSHCSHLFIMKIKKKSTCLEWTSSLHGAAETVACRSL